MNDAAARSLLESMPASRPVPAGRTLSRSARTDHDGVVVGPEERGAVLDDRVCWSTVGGMSLIHVASIAGCLWIMVNPSAATLVLAAVMYVLCGLAITAGYHRLFAHRTYRASPPVRWVMLAFGAAAFQNSALSWSADHRAHHANTDRAADPHAVTRGVWFAHMGWLFRRRVASADVRRLDDLWSLRSIRWQHHWYPVRGRGDRAPRANGRRRNVGRSMGWSARGGLPPRRHHAAGNVLHQLARPSRGNQALRPAVLGTRQHAHGARHLRRGLPQLPPPLPVRLSQRDPLVALRPEQVAHLDDGPPAAGHQGAIRVTVHHRPSCRHDSRKVRSAGAALCHDVPTLGCVEADARRHRS